MATVHSVESDSGSSFLGDRVATSFPRHEVVKLDAETFIQWQQQVRLILRGYGLLGFLDGTLSAPPSSFLSSFTDVSTAGDVWRMANNLFAADTTAKQSQLRHDLHSLRKGTLSVRLYVDRIKNLCALLAASGSPISEAECTAVLLVGLPTDFEAIVSHASLSPVPLSFQRLVDALLEWTPLQPTDGGLRGGRLSGRGRGRTFRPCIQCQICSRFGHLMQRCYYRYDRDG
ncbi:uncharacterized protein LOC108471599 [Gossypium arboreum]|uniref:uncharacterized protein LOC108471599 n=1 Tax=Gossypium arboreum TaxID=29729 RepID=UPI0008194DB6|nr:uncharacterized protein LOC108471599 [Gossypium arboreum]